MNPKKNDWLQETSLSLLACEREDKAKLVELVRLDWWLVGECAGERQSRVAEPNWTPEDLYQAEEVFPCGTCAKWKWKCNCWAQSDRDDEEEEEVEEIEEDSLATLG